VFYYTTIGKTFVNYMPVVLDCILLINMIWINVDTISMPGRHLFRIYLLVSVVQLL
jgi:hypothetical protein